MAEMLIEIVLGKSNTFCLQAVDSAESAVNSARENVRSSEWILNNKREEVRDFENQLKSKKSQLEDKKWELKEQLKVLEEKKKTQKRLLALSEKLKYVTTFIATTLGRTKVSGSHYLKHYYVLRYLVLEVSFAFP